VTELALLRVPLSAGSSSATTVPTSLSAVPAPIRAGLLKAKNAMQNFSGEKFAFALLEVDEKEKPETTMLESQAQVRGAAGTAEVDTASAPEETIDVLIIGGWPSVDFHVKTWLPSPENQALVAEIGNSGATTRWMWHIDHRREDLEPLLASAAASRASGLYLHRLIIDSPERRKQAEVVLADLEERIGSSDLVWAWRIDAGYWAEGEIDMKGKAEDGAAELVVLHGTGPVEDDEKRIRSIIEGLVDVAVSSNRRVGMVMDI
jgi:hypothetical protein